MELLNGWEFEGDNFKQKWTHIESAGVKHLVSELLDEEYGITEPANSYLGLTYTSSSSCAMMRIYNVNMYTPEGYKWNFFAITNNDMLVLVAEDEEENYYSYEI